MPLSFGVPSGLAIVLLGAILFLATRLKTAAKILIAVGLAITILTVIVIILASRSPM